MAVRLLAYSLAVTWELAETVMVQTGHSSTLRTRFNPAPDDDGGHLTHRK